MPGHCLWPVLLLASSPLAANDEISGRAAARTYGCEIALGVIDVVPATFEAGPWLHLAGGFRSQSEMKGVFSVGTGVEGTFGLATLGTERRYGGAFELRLGPWVGLESPLDRLRGEGGLTFHVGQTRHAQWGTFGFRFGGGYSSFGVAHVVTELDWGVRYVESRLGPTRGVCDPPKLPDSFAFVSGARIFAALRRDLQPNGNLDVIFGLAFEPSWFFPPYSLGKWIGAPL